MRHHPQLVLLVYTTHAQTSHVRTDVVARYCSRFFATHAQFIGTRLTKLSLDKMHVTWGKLGGLGRLVRSARWPTSVLVRGRTVATDHSSQQRAEQPLVDGFGRVHDYLRISLTERCNLRCTAINVLGVLLQGLSRFFTFCSSHCLEYNEIWGCRNLKNFYIICSQRLLSNPAILDIFSRETLIVMVYNYTILVHSLFKLSDLIGQRKLSDLLNFQSSPLLLCC